MKQTNERVHLGQIFLIDGIKHQVVILMPLNKKAILSPMGVDGRATNLDKKVKKFTDLLKKTIREG